MAAFHFQRARVSVCPPQDGIEALTIRRGGLAHDPMEFVWGGGLRVSVRVFVCDLCSLKEEGGEDKVAEPP
jgi:hypothetical protein